jgi:predicted DNA-binding transcriptional regulator AlpA
MIKFLRPKEAAQRLGVHRTTLWRKRHELGLRPVEIMPGVTGYVESEVEAVQRALIEKRDQEGAQ